VNITGEKKRGAAVMDSTPRNIRKIKNGKIPPPVNTAQSFRVCCRTVHSEFISESMTVKID